jgi:hypothetical protein
VRTCHDQPEGNRNGPRPGRRTENPIAPRDTFEQDTAMYAAKIAALGRLRHFFQESLRAKKTAVEHVTASGRELLGPRVHRPVVEKAIEVSDGISSSDPPQSMGST